MGIWKGTAPLSRKGDWSHGPILQLKFNAHRFGAASVSEEDVRMVGEAYSLATAMVQSALRRGDGSLTIDFDRLLDTYFGAREEGDAGFGAPVDLATIERTLRLTADGLRDNSKDNRLYLFTPQSKRGTTAYGYVASYPDTSLWKDKRHRPLGPVFGPQPVVGQTFTHRKGHIHFNHADERGQSLEHRAWTIVHEATHRFAGTGDFALVDHAERYTRLSAAERVNNADSYAAFCVAVYYNR